MIHHVIFRVTSDKSDDDDGFMILLEDMELDEGVSCSITQLPGLVEFDFGIDLSSLPVPHPIAARSTACAYLLRGLVGMNLHCVA